MLSTLANIGEFVGGLAVLITIVYFAIQLRANLKANKAQALAAWTSAAQAEKQIIFSDAEFARIYREIVLEGNSARDDEYVRIIAYFIQLMNTWQLAFIQHKLGIMSDEFLERVSSGYVMSASSEVAVEWWRSGGSQLHDPAFVDFVEARVAVDG